MDHAREQFGELVSPGGGALAGELDYGAILIAAAVEPGTDVTNELARLDALADSMTPSNVAELSEALFGGARPDPAVHFRGNQQAYYDAQNSLLPRVLDRRVGIPITLSLLLIEVGRRHGIILQGVGMPGHFLARAGNEFVDAFHGGAIFDERGCEAVFQRLVGEPVPLPDGALDPTAPAFILMRMLNNLSAIASSSQNKRMLHAVRSLIAVFPEADHRDHIQHAYAASQVGQYGEAASAAERALRTVPDQVRPRLEGQIATWRARLN